MSFRKLSEKIINSRYVSRWLILHCDSIISAISTLGVYLVLAYFNRIIVPPDAFLLIFLTSLVVSIAVFFVFGTYKGIVRHTSIYEIWRIFISVIIKAFLLFIIFAQLRYKYDIHLHTSAFIVTQVCDILFSLASLVSIRVLLISVYEIFMAANNKQSKKVLIYGDDVKSVAASTYLSKNFRSEYITMGFIARERKANDFRLTGLNVYDLGDYSKLLNVIRKKFISSIIFPSQHSALLEREGLIKFCLKNKIKVFIVPQLSEVSKLEAITSTIREIKIEDLLGRDEIKIDMEEISSFFNNKKVMVTGGAGSIGSELARLISGFNIKQLIVFDAAETPLHNIQLELKDLEQKRLKENFSEENFNKKFNFVIADVRARSRVESVFDKYRPDIVFHAAAYKHVPLMESNPCEAVNTNVLGTKNIADLAVKYDVEKVVMVSTDKAVNPTNVMGCSKRLAEIYVQSLSQAIIQGKISGKTKFITTRFGNVLGSNGSVIPRFLEQIKKGGPITVTHKDIIRYFMTIPEACRLVLEAATMGEGYEIFVFDMGQPVKISDLAKDMIYLSGLVPDVDIKIEYTGLRPGEKLYEELLNDKELTIPTANEKIFVAKVRQYDYNEVESLYQNFTTLTKTLDNTETVKLMKKIVPEFISKNSYFHNLDK